MKINESQISITINTYDYRGDHSADIEVALAYIPGETIEELVRRAGLDYKDYIALRVVLDSVVEATS